MNNYGPRIVTDGLICCLDAADRNSYTGSGSTWYDLSGNSSPSSLATPTFSNNNGGCFDFNGSSNYFRFSPLLDLGNTFTINGFIKLNGVNTAGSIYIPHGNGSDNQLRIINNQLSLIVCEFSDSTSTIITSTTTLDTSNTVWYSIAITVDVNTIKLYINGELEDSDTAGYTIASWSSTTSYGLTYNSADIGRRSGCCGYDTNYFKGSIACLSFYNKVLTNSEIRQNFEATKGRFGL